MDGSSYDNMDLEAGGVKYDTGKVRMDLLPQDALMGIAQVLTYGAIKYDDWNWAKGMRAGRLLAAFDRHKAAWMLGEEVDEESGLPHLWHMGCCILMLISGENRDVLTDDRAPIAGTLLQVLRNRMGRMVDPRQPQDDEKFGYGPDLEEGGALHQAMTSTPAWDDEGIDVDWARGFIAEVMGVPMCAVQCVGETADGVGLRFSVDTSPQREVMSLTEAVDRGLLREGESALYAGFDADGSKHPLTTDPISDPWSHADPGLTPVTVLQVPGMDEARMPLPLRFSVGDLGEWRGRANGYRCMVIV